ncbi:MAG: hypothetical protein KAS36_03135, partial [Anaerolineales bacterium]|nr:hypothetical protein [Anaerolineales bacterium]
PEHNDAFSSKVIWAMILFTSFINIVPFLSESKVPGAPPDHTACHAPDQPGCLGVYAVHKQLYGS